MTDAVVEWLGAHAHWSVEGNALVRTFQAKSFPAAIAFVSRIAQAAEAAQHHPDIDIRYRQVTLRLTTHDAGNTVTERDMQLAARADELFNLG